MNDAPEGRQSVLWPVARLGLNLLLVALGVAVITGVVVELRLVVVPILISLLLASLLTPIADLLRRRVPSALATLLAMFGAGVLLLGLLLLIVPAVVDQISEVGSSAQAGLDQALDWLTEGPLDLTEAQVDNTVDDIAAALQGTDALTGRLLGGAALLGELVTGAALVVILVFFFVHDGERIWSWTVRLFPPHRHRVVERIGSRAWAVVSGYVRGVGIVALVDAVLIGLALVLIGVPLVIPLMALTFLGAFVPLVGAVAAGAVAALVALVSGGVVDAVLVVVAITVIQQVEGDLLYPLVVGQAISLHPVAILVALTAGTVLAGVVGTLLVVPVAAAGWAVVDELRSESSRGSPDAPEE